MSDICLWGFDDTNQAIAMLVYSPVKSLVTLFGIKGLSVKMCYRSVAVISILAWENNL